MVRGAAATVRRRVDFYTGRVLRLDLTALTATVEPLDEEWARLYVGGKGLLLRYLFAELRAGHRRARSREPAHPGHGPFAGTAAATCSRLAVGCKSPATGTLLDSYVGGSFAPELKFAGYDVVVITGRAPHPVLVLIEDDRVEFLPAEGRFWGLETAALEQQVREEMGPWHKVLSTGPAGEQPRALRLPLHRPVPQGRPRRRRRRDGQQEPQGGGGARHRRRHRRRRRPRSRATCSTCRTSASSPPDNAWTYEEGTPFLVDLVNAAGALPTRNWRAGQFEGADRIDSAKLLEVRTKIRACTQCPLACRQVHRFGDHVCEGPEFETLGLCGANCGIGDLAAIAAFNRACDELGLDTMSTGAVVALAMDLCEQGAADYGLAFGDAAGYLAAPGLIARREGWGAELALGARDLAALKGRPELAPHIKGLELPAYDPRGTFGMGLGYATSDRGACHMRAFTRRRRHPRRMRRRPTPWRASRQLVAEQQDFSALAWTGVWCANMYMDTDFLGVHFRHLWGRETSHEELMTTGARIWNLGRLLNLREGFGREHDRLPAILDVPHPDGAAAGKTVGAEEFRAALDEYYRVRGWDADGVPTEETLARLSLDVRL